MCRLGRFRHPGWLLDLCSKLLCLRLYRGYDRHLRGITLRFCILFRTFRSCSHRFLYPHIVCRNLFCLHNPGTHIGPRRMLRLLRRSVHTDRSVWRNWPDRHTLPRTVAALCYKSIHLVDKALLAGICCHRHHSVGRIFSHRHIHHHRGALRTNKCVYICHLRILLRLDIDCHTGRNEGDLRGR